MNPWEDLQGQAIFDYWKKKHKKGYLKLHNSYGVPEKMYLDSFFRGWDELPEVEEVAMEVCEGSILDIGAGAGRHALILQEMGKEVSAIEVSPLCAEVMRQRGVKNVIEGDIFIYKDQKFDTLLMLMNGIGLVGTLEKLEEFMILMKGLISPDGQWVFDSSDITYLYSDTELPTDKYFGEIEYQYEYNKLKGPWFKWLYVDKTTLTNMAIKTGWEIQIIYENDQDEFLARLTLA